MTERKAIENLQKAYGKVDFDAGSYLPLEIAVTVAKRQLKNNGHWTSLHDVIKTCVAVLE